MAGRQTRSLTLFATKYGVKGPNIDSKIRESLRSRKKKKEKKGCTTKPLASEFLKKSNWQSSDSNKKDKKKRKKRVPFNIFHSVAHVSMSMTEGRGSGRYLPRKMKKKKQGCSDKKKEMGFHLSMALSLS